MTRNTSPSEEPPPEPEETPKGQTPDAGGESAGARGDELELDSRSRSDRRSGRDRRQRSEPVAHDRRKGPDRRQGADRRRGGRKRNMNAYPMSDDAQELAEAVARFRRENGNRFPTAAQLLNVLHDLGYRKGEGG